MERELHVVFGSGQVGVTLAEILLAAGKQVRLVKRRKGAVPATSELMLGDATDGAFCRQACSGAKVVYHCINPEYSAKAWKVMLQPIMDNLIQAAGELGARLVVLDNLYMLGHTNGKPMSETTLSNPCSQKGEIRARVAERLFDAHRQGKVQAVCGRAADFYGPRGTLTIFGDYFWKPVLAGKVAMTPVNLSMVHTYHYIPDVAQGLAALGCADQSKIVAQPIWMLPCQPAVTTLEMIKRFEVYLEQPVRMNIMPSWLFKPLGMVIPIMRELGEMTYQWDEPFIVDDSLFRANFDVRPITVDAAAKATVEWARNAYN